MKTVKTKIKGVKGWQEKLQKVYSSFDEFASYSAIYGIAQRLGYKNVATAWRANPTIEGSVYPEDLRKVPKNEKPKKWGGYGK